MAKGLLTTRRGTTLARSDLLVTLVKAGSTGDTFLFKQVVEALIAEERAKQHHVLADQLARNLQSETKQGLRVIAGPSQPPVKGFLELTPKKLLSDLILPAEVKEICDEIIEEHNRRELLRSYGLEPRHKFIVAGPPGNGKTSLAEAVAEALALPLLVVKYDALIDSHLGATGQNLGALFDYVRSRACVLFFDEFDAIGKERGDRNESGEIKRVVSSLLLQIDTIPSHVIVMAATNHPELLDRAVWRRFQARFFLPQPTAADVIDWCSKFEKRSSIDLGSSKAKIAERFSGMSFAELEEFTLDVQRRLILSGKNESSTKLLKSRLKHWESRFFPRS